MPYQLQKSGSGYVVVNPATGRKHSNRPMSRTRAVRQMRALYAAESKSYPDQRQFAGYTMEDWDDTKPDSFYHASGKDADTVAVPMLSGSGGLLGTPGMGRRGRKWGKRRIRTKAQSAQDRAIFAKLGKGGGKGGGGGSKLWPKNDEGKRVPPGGKKDEITAENVKINATVENGRYGKRHTYKIDGMGDNFLTTTHRVDGLRSVSTFHLPPEARGKGIGQQMLLRALRDGDIAKESGNGVSDAYRRVQDSLIRKGKVKVHKDEYDNSIMSLSAKGKTKSYAGRKWGNRRKSPDCTCGIATKGEQIAPGITRIRGNLCNVHGRYGPCDAGASAARKPKKGRTARAKKPIKTPEQRLAERQAAQAENRSKVLSGLGIGADGQKALEALRSGQQPDAAALLSGGFEQAGLVERAADGSYRLTASGRAAMNAANAGDQGRAGDIISGARDRLGARQGRQAAAEQRKQEVAARRAEAEAARKKRQEEAQKKRGSGGGSKQTGGRGGEDRSAERAQREAERQADRARRLREHEEDRSRRQREHEADRAARELERQQRGSAQQQPAQTATAPAERVSGTRPSVQGPSRKRGRLQRTNVGIRTKAETYGGIKRSNLDDNVFAGPDRSFPIKTAQDVRDAVRSLGRTKHDKAAVKRGIIRRARAIGATDALPESWREKSFTVFKSADGSYRWIARTTTAYRDRDGEIITTKALETDAARMAATGQFGPLRYWHLGMPDPFNPTAPWGKGVDVGDCDYSTVIGQTSIESGTFKSAEIGAAFAASAGDYELSPGFFHPVDQPTPVGEYEEIRRFERSVVPIKYGRASNLFTGMTVKEHRMDANEYERRMKAFAADMNGKGVPPEVAGAVIAGMEQADKSAQAQGIAYKADDPWQAVIAALKAAMAPASMEQAADTEMDDALADQADEGDMPEDDGEYVGDMSPVAFKAMMGEMLAPVLKMQDMLKAMSDMHGELKGMMGGVATKDASEITALKTAIADATKRLALLEGDRPAVVSSADVEAALKGAPQAPPDPNAPIVPKDDPSRPYAAVAAATFPNLYRQNPDGSFGGWQPPMSNS